jgi:hypothetical protein
VTAPEPEVSREDVDAAVGRLVYSWRTTVDWYPKSAPALVARSWSPADMAWVAERADEAEARAPFFAEFRGGALSGGIRTHLGGLLNLLSTTHSCTRTQALWWVLVFTGAPDKPAADAVDALISSKVEFPHWRAAAPGHLAALAYAAGLSAAETRARADVGTLDGAVLAGMAVLRGWRLSTVPPAPAHTPARDGKMHS